MFAQETTIFSARPNSNKYIIHIVPQSTAENALRIDVERRLMNGTSIIFAPRFYAKSSSSWELNNDGKMFGFGGEVFQKIRVNDLAKPVRAYFCYGMLYNYYDVINVETVWEPSSSLEISTLESVDKENHIGINKFGPSLYIGVECEPIERFIIDISAGFGARYSFVSKGDKNYIQNHTRILEMGYTGVLPLGVVKLGIVF